MPRFPESPASQGRHELVSAWSLAGPPGAPLCCLVPSTAGARLLRHRGERGLAEALSPWLEAEGIRAPLRLVEALPAPGSGPRPRPRMPQFQGLTRSGDTLTACFDVPVDLAIFAGHFPWVPIVPGAMLVGWCADLAAREGLWVHGVCRISSVKFRQIVQPGPGYRLRLVRGDGGLRLDLRIESDRAMHASGTLLAPTP